MYEMTVRTPGLTWVRVASSVDDAIAFLRAGNFPGCDIEINDRHGARVTLERLIGLAHAAADLARSPFQAFNEELLPAA